MTVRVLFFAHLRDVAGASEVSIAVPAGATVEGLRAAVAQRWPALAAQLGRYPAVVNGQVVGASNVLGEGDEVAWLPPVAGGAEGGAGAVVDARLTREVIDPQALARAAAAPAAGAVVLFVGCVRDHEGERRVERLEYEAYESLARERLAAVARDGLARWPQARIALAHRVGVLEIGEVSVAVAVAAAHRGDAFDCCRYVVDRIKTAVPIWKRSHGPGGATWVEGVPYEGGP